MSDQAHSLKAYWDGLDFVCENFENELIANECPSADVPSFRILSFLAFGGFGEVYCAQRDERIYAIKKINKTHVRFNRNQAMIVREKMYQYAMNSKFVVKLFSKFRDRDNLYLVMEFAQFGDLFTLLSNFEGPLSESMSKSITVQIALGIEYLHACNIVYRDMKPENIVVFEGGRAKICDFGLVVQSTEKISDIAGTGIFLAPEQHLGRQYDGTVDWWALGVTLCEMILGRYPFGEPNLSDQEKERLILTAPIEGLDDAEITHEAKDFIQRLLDKNSDSRLGAGLNGSREVREHPWLRGVDYYSVIFEDYQFYIEENFKFEGEESSDEHLQLSGQADQDYQDADFEDF